MSMLSSLRPQVGSTHRSKLLGRGRGSGKGGTSGKGHKGQKARKSGNIRRGFEGGQTPLHRRSPKFGFTNNMFKTEYNIVNLTSLNQFTGEVGPDQLRQAGLTGKGLVKILAKGEVSKGLKVSAHKFSEKAKAAIEKAGGQVELLKI